MDLAVEAARRATAQRTGASTGVAHSREAPGAAALLALADERMYAAKRRRAPARAALTG